MTHLATAPAYGTAVESVREVVAVAGQGLEGDRYFGNRRQVTIVAAGELAAAAAELGLGSIDPLATRRNITVDLDELPRAHGTPIHIGDVELAVWRDCAPCEVMDQTVGPGARAAMRGRGGVSATVVIGGTIRIGDAVSL